MPQSYLFNIETGSVFTGRFDDHMHMWMWFVGMESEGVSVLQRELLTSEVAYRFQNPLRWCSCGH